MPLLTSYIIIATILTIVEIGYIYMARRLRIVENPNARTSHSQSTITGAGIIFLIGAWIWAAFFGLQYPQFMLGLSIIGIVSFIDDISPLPVSLRLIVQFAAISMMTFDLGLLHTSPWWVITAAFILGVGIVNAFNFMDGINGITGCYSLAVLLPLLYLNHTVNFINTQFLVVIAISVGVFLIFNFRRKAMCFAGDIGSISIAFILLYAICRLIIATGNPTYILLIGVYGVDTVLTIAHRIILHENPELPHRKHAYQILANELKMPHTVVAAIYMVAQLAVSCGLIICQNFRWTYFIAVCIILSGAYLIFMHKYYHLHAAYLENIENEKYNNR